MPADTVASRRRSLAGQKAALSRSRAADDPEFVSVSQNLTEQQAADYIKRVLAAAPPLSDEQRSRLAELLRPARQPNPARETSGRT